MPKPKQVIASSCDNLYAPLRGFEDEQARLAAGREKDYEVPPEDVTEQTKRIARRNHCLAIPTRGTSKDGMPFLHFGEHQVMQSWEHPYMKELAEVATSALHKGDVLELGYGMGISGSYIQDIIKHWNKYHPREHRTHHISELNLDVAIDCIKKHRQAIHTGRLILHVGDWRELLADLPGELALLDATTIHDLITRWRNVSSNTNKQGCNHIIAVDTNDAIDFIRAYKEDIADARVQLHIGNWPAVVSRLKTLRVALNKSSLLEPQMFGGALLDTYALTSDERHFNQIPALRPVARILADGGVLTYYGDAEKDYQTAHRQMLIDAGFHPENIDCVLFSFERYIKKSAYKNKYNKLNGMIIPRIIAGAPNHCEQKLAASRQLGYTQPDNNKYHHLTRKAGLAYAAGWFKGTQTPFTLEDLVSLANKIQRLFDHFSNGEVAERIIEVGCGTNLGNTIAAVPFCREFIGIERSPALVALVNDWTNNNDSKTAAMWDGWMELAGLYYAQASLPNGHALSWLVNLINERPDLYETIRTWNQLPKTHLQKATLLSNALTIGQKTGLQNPFLSAKNVSELVKGKIKFITADLIDEINGNTEKTLADIRPYSYTADVVLANYVHESVNPELLGAAHSLLNTARLAKPTGLIMSTFMEKTFRYSGFLKPLDECYASASVFKKLHEQISNILPARLNYTQVNAADAGRFVRNGYAGVVAYDGYRSVTLPADAQTIIDNITGDAVNKVIVLRAAPLYSRNPKTTSRKAPVRAGYCLVSEQKTFEKEMLAEYQRLYGVTAKVSSGAF